MKKLLIAVLAFVLSTPALAQSTKSALTTLTASSFQDQTLGAITPAIMRSWATSVINSFQQYLGVNSQTGTSYTFQVSDYGQLVTFNNASATAVSLPQGSGTFFPFNVYVSNLGNGTATITPVGSTINGASSYPLLKGATAQFVSDGNNWQVIASGFSGTVTGTAPVVVSGAGVVSLSTDANFSVCSNSLCLASIPAGNLIGNGTTGAAEPTSTTPSSLLAQFYGAGTAGQLFESAGSGNAQAWALCAPQFTTLTTGTNATFNTPTCSVGTATVTAKYLEIELQGGGGGGAGSGSSPGASGVGNNTCWNTSGTACSTPLFSANGGAAGVSSSTTGAVGGTTTGCDIGITGASGGGASASISQTGGIGGNSFFGGGGPGGPFSAGAIAGLAATTNSGSGGGGASDGATINSGGGGAAGGYCRKVITAPAGSYVYTVGTGGAGGTLGTSGAAGGNGAAGLGRVVARWY